MKLPSTSTLLWTLLAITVTAQSNYTCVGVPCLNFTQKLNHDKPDDLTTFQQRYQLDTSHFKPGGPILFHQSEELPLSSTPISHHVFSDYASKLGGIAVALEHRYFGTSYPSGLSVTSNITAAQYAPLTLDNIFEDSVAFLKWVKETVPGAENSPVIYGGGSYGGFLAILARVHYPETFNGSISFAPICKSFGKSVTLQENPWKFAATDKIATIYWDANADASRKIKKTVRKLYDCIKDNTCEKSFSDMNLCTKPSGPEEWEALLNEIILEQYAEIPQFDYSNLDLQSLINATLSAKSSAEVLLAPINFALKKLNLTSSSQNCTDYQSLLTFISNVGIGPSWGYITCNWLPASLSAISPSNSLFPPRQVNDSTIYCTNPSFTGPDINNTNSYFEKKFGITDNELDKTRNLLIVNGAKDRTSAVCKPNLKEGNSRDKSRVLEVWDMSHGDSAFSESVLPRGKRGNVDAVRDMQLAYVMEWLGVSAEGEGGGY